MVETHYPFIERALAAVDGELGIATTERRAFERFRSRLSAVNPAPPRPGPGSPAAGSPVLAVAGSNAGTQGKPLERVRTAYRETVMSVPHFDAEYGDSLRESVAIEFGVDVASRVTADGALTPTLREALLAAAASKVDEREEYERSLRRERESLRDVQSGLADCEKRAHALGDAAAEAAGDELADLDARFAALEETCDDLAAERQRVIHGRRVSRISGITGDSLAGLLYADLETSCPALREVAGCLDTVRSHRRQCLR